MIEEGTFEPSASREAPPLSSLGGRLDGDSASVRRWSGMLLVRGAP